MSRVTAFILSFIVSFCVVVVTNLFSTYSARKVADAAYVDYRTSYSQYLQQLEVVQVAEQREFGVQLQEMHQNDRHPCFTVSEDIVGVTAHLVFLLEELSGQAMLSLRYEHATKIPIQSRVTEYLSMLLALQLALPVVKYYAQEQATAWKNGGICFTWNGPMQLLLPGEPT